MHRASPIAVAVAALLANADARAESGAESTAGQTARLDLEELVVTATRVATPVLEVPAMIHSLSAEDLQQINQSRTLPEALGELPGVMVQKTGHAQGSPFIRGYTGFRNVLLIDGIRLNNSVFRDGANQYWATVDSFSIERIELLKGPASVLYGSDAIGGTVNALTGIPNHAGEGFTPRVALRYGDAENSTAARGEAIWNGERLRAIAGYTWRDYDDLEGGRDVGEQPKTNYSEDGANLRVEYDWSDETQLVLGYQYVDQDDAWRTHRTPFGLTWQGTVTGSDRVLSFDQRRQLGYVQLAHAGLGAFADAVKVSLSYHEQSEDNYRVRSNLRQDELGFDVRTSGLWAQFDKRIGPVQLVYGFDWYRDDVSSFNVQYNVDGSVRSVGVQGPVADDATYDLAGLYVQGEWQVSPRFTASLGGRYTWAAAEANEVADPLNPNVVLQVDEDWDDLSGSAQLSFRPAADGPWMLYASLAQAFRAPNLSDLTRLDTARSNELEVPSPGVDPERFLTWELGAKYAGERLSLQAAVFETDGSDVIIRTPTGRKVGNLVEVTKTNAGESQVQGLEVQVAWAIVPELIAFADGVYIDGEGDAFPSGPAATPVTEPLDVGMPPSWRAGLRWSSPAQRWRLEGVVEHSDEQDRLSTRDRQDTQRIPPGGTPSFTVLHVRSSWQVAESLVLSLAVENLTDTDYRIHGSGVNEPGRNVIASFSWSP